jgi:galactose mutarotase-like enzyme
VALPDYGGMVSSLCVGGLEVLRMKPELLGLGNCLAGGIPILFPFCGRTADDTYRVGEKPYTMPFHGLVKDTTFSVRRKGVQEVCMYTEPGTVVLRENYPYSFMLDVIYRVEAQSLYVTAQIENRSDSPMPFYIGWHPYLRVSSKKDATLKLGAEQFKSYIDGAGGIWNLPEVDLQQRLDHVFWDLTEAGIELENRPDGYRARIIPDDLHGVVTVCTVFDDCVCIEPWTGMPNSINTGKRLHHIEPGSSQKCGFELRVDLL